MTAPSLLFKVEPEYSEEARKAKNPEEAAMLTNALAKLTGRTPLQHASSKPILSLVSSFQLCSATSNSQPSGISPSKKESITLLVYGLSVRGNVKLTASAFGSFR